MAPGPQPGGYSEIIDVRVVNLEVVVTDREGVPIRGLDADQFQLLVDGEEVPIEYFSEVLGGRVVAPAEGTETVPGLRQVQPGERVGTSYLVFVDNFFSLPTDRNRVLRSLEESGVQLELVEQPVSGRVISVPDHLPNRMRSPTFTSSGRTEPSSLMAPPPTATTSPS